MTSANKRTQIQKKYDLENTVSYKMKLNKKTDKEIIEQLNRVPSRQGYIKSLVLRDIRKNGYYPKEQEP